MPRTLKEQMTETEPAKLSAWQPSTPKRPRKMQLTTAKTDAELDAMDAHMTALCGAKKDTPKPTRKIQLEQEEE